MVSLTVDKTKNGMELFDLLAEAYPDFPAREIKSAFKAGNILLNGEEAYGDDVAEEGDIIRLFVAGDVVGADLTPKIVYNDQNFIFVDKPAGLSTVSDAGEPNAVDMVEESMKQKGEYSLAALVVPYLIYPLDKDIGGLLLFAKHEHAYLFLADALDQRRIARHFVCPVKGRAEENEELLAYWSQDKAGRRVDILTKPRKGARPIVTRYKTLAAEEDMSLISVRPVTNYAHQIRAHLAFGGLPVLGDSVYGDSRFNRKYGTDRIALRLMSVCFEVGTGHEYRYLNGKTIESGHHDFPKCVFDLGLVEADW